MTIIAYVKVFEEIHAGLVLCIRASDRFNAIYMELDFVRIMVYVVAHNGQMARCANSARSWQEAQTRRGSRCVTRHLEQAEGVYGCLAETVSHQLETLYDVGILKRHDSLDVTVDMHLIPRHDKKHGAELVRSRYVWNIRL